MKTYCVGENLLCFTLWLCQNSYWKSPLLIGKSSITGPCSSIFHSYVNVYQRLNLHFPMVFLWLYHYNPRPYQAETPRSLGADHPTKSPSHQLKYLLAKRIFAGAARWLSSSKCTKYVYRIIDRYGKCTTLPYLTLFRAVFPYQISHFVGPGSWTRRSDLHRGGEARWNDRLGMDR